MNGADLDTYLRRAVPNAHLQTYTLEGTNNLRLLLINEDYPQAELSAEQAQQLMDDPPYWAFCWASGWVLAQQLISHPGWVSGKRVLDLGCGSGVAGIAALKAGASVCTFCDADATALAATRENLRINRYDQQGRDDFAAPTICLASRLDEVDLSLVDVVLIADVFYDAENLPLLPQLQAKCDNVIVADSRLAGRDLDGMKIDSVHRAATVPDLGEALAFRQVTIYRSTH